MPNNYEALQGKETIHGATKRRRSGNADEVAETLKDLLITQLGMAGVSQQSIRQIVGCDMNRVNRIVKHLKAAKRKEED